MIVIKLGDNMKAYLLIGLLVLSLLLVGCAGETKYVCPDGSTVMNAEECKLPEPEIKIETEYVCIDGSTVESAEECIEMLETMGEIVMAEEQPTEEEHIPMVVSGEVIGDRGLVITQHNFREGGAYNTIVGMVKNDADSPANYVRIVATLYDKDKQVIGVETGRADYDPILRKKSSPFSITIYKNTYPDLRFYELKAKELI